MATASELFFARLRYWLVVGGMTMRRACGRMTRRRAVPRRSPRAAAASLWPRGTAWMPPRTFSAMKAAVYSTSPASSDRNSGVMLLPPRKVKRVNTGTSSAVGAPLASHTSSGGPKISPSDGSSSLGTCPVASWRRFDQPR